MRWTEAEVEKGIIFEAECGERIFIDPHRKMDDDTTTARGMCPKCKGEHTFHRVAPKERSIKLVKNQARNKMQTVTRIKKFKDKVREVLNEG